MHRLRDSPRIRADPRKRKYARTIIESAQQMADSPRRGVLSKSYSALKQEQRELLARVGDEALSEWELLRLKIRRDGPL